MLFCAASLHADPSQIPHGTLDLVAENQWIAAGHGFSIGLFFQLEKGWHIYWINPGDSGEPPRVTWQLPSGLTASEIQWPTPRRLGSSSIVDYGYEGSVLLIVPMHATSSLVGSSARLAGEVKLLVCSDEMCLPGKTQLALTLPVRSQTPATDSRNANLFAAARKSMPRAAPANWKFSVADTNDSFVLTARLGRRVTRAVFFPLVESQIANAAAQTLGSENGGFRLTLRKSDQFSKPIERLKGVLVLPADGSHPEESYTIDAPVGKSAEASQRRAARFISRINFPITIVL